LIYKNSLQGISQNPAAMAGFFFAEKSKPPNGVAAQSVPNIIFC